MSRMNSDSRNDPMLSSIQNEEWLKLLTRSTDSPNEFASLAMLPCSSSPFTLPVEGLLSPEQGSSFGDFWSTERKENSFVKTEVEDSFPDSSCVVSNEDMKEDVVDDLVSCVPMRDVKQEIEDNDYDVTMTPSGESYDEYEEENSCHQANDTCHQVNDICHQMSEAEARKFVEEQFQKIAFVPSSKLSQREKISYILARSDCKEFTVENILNFDKRNAESARACAKIVQNIPQRYRWDCVSPRDIPCCYTIVADCKKVSSRDKPPRPMNAFMIWAQGARRLINELCPKMQNALISEALGYYWRQKSDEFKKQFEEEKIKLRQFHNVEFPAYKYKPKTKVQKAKEKQELSLTRAKMRATVKREKLTRGVEDSELYKRRANSKIGRPKKLADTKMAGSSEKTHGQNEASMAVCNSPSKPGIKDMLTLKIMNDKRLKSEVSSNTYSKVQSAFGQLSPIEVDGPGVGVFDNINIMDTTDPGREADADPHVKAMTPSVYDTPANTPPLSDELHHSPSQPLPTPASPLPSIPSSSLYSPSAISPSKPAFKPSISSILSGHSTGHSTGLSTGASTSNAQNLFPSQVIVPSALRIQTKSDQDYIITFLSEASTPTKSSTTPSSFKHTALSDTIDANNNDSDFNNNHMSNGNHLAMDNHSNPRFNFLEPTDLDSLALDLNLPLLSEDEMTSLLHSLQGQFMS